MVSSYFLVVRKLAGLPRKLLKKVFYGYCCLYAKFKGFDSLNVGGGPNFIYPGWLNLDAVKSSFNPKYFKLSADATFPLKDASIKLTYSSHCLEHLDVKTVERTLREILRVLKNNGQFIVKLPDFDRALSAWRCDDASFFSDAFWGYPSVTDTWKSRKIDDCLDYRASMIFCGFWNTSYGDHYAQKVSKNSTAYHGPAVTSIELLHKIKHNNTPSQISAILSSIVTENEKDYWFNHRNAWSRKELKDLLAFFGFKIITFEKDLILAKFSHIPGIRLQEKQSMYCWANKIS